MIEGAVATADFDGGISVAPTSYLIGPSSYASDRYVPACDIIVMPERQFPSGKLRLTFGPGVAEAKGGRALRRLRRLSERIRDVLEVRGPVLDARSFTPSNWAHFLAYHVPLVARAATVHGIPLADVTILLPEDIPEYILRVCEVLGLRTLRTDGNVAGDLLGFEDDVWSRIRGFRRAAVLETGLPEVCRARQPEPGRFASARLFLSRRGNRTLENEREIVAFLEARGFAVLYPEDLSAAEQIQLFQEADDIVGIHGAGLAPLLYRPEEAASATLIELQPVGLGTTFFREIAHQSDVYWTGVRGRMKSRYVPAIYRDAQPFTEYSNDSFTVDPASLELALALAAERRTPPSGFGDTPTVKTKT